MHGVRLLTLVGPGGAGKTSLALTLAVQAREAFPDGVFGVRLASVTTADQVPVAVADALGMPMDGAAAERDIRERIYSYLARRKLLLVLDNCEHVIDAAASLADDILGRCADVTVLATSREALAVPDEVQVNIGPLDAPPEDAPAQRSSAIRPPSCSSSVPARYAPAPSTTKPPCSPSAASPAPWTASRSPSSWPPPAPAPSHPSRSPTAWTTGSLS